MSIAALCSDRVLLNDWHVIADLTNLSAHEPFQTRLLGIDLSVHCRGRYNKEVVRNDTGALVNSIKRYGFLWACLGTPERDIVFVPEAEEADRYLLTGGSIAVTFFATAAAFAGLSLWGYTTHKNLSGMGTFLIMGVVGLIVASLVNLFVQSAPLMYAISFIGVLIFAGLTAYDTQKLKEQYAHLRGTEWAGKAVVLGALNLYLDFINMFLFLLRFMGSSRN